MSFKDNLSNNDFLNDEKHKPKVKYVREHVNHINFCDNKGRVFCRLTNKVEFVPSKRHGECPCLAGSCQGQGIDCEWEDYLPENYRIPYVESPQDEYKRVKELIKQGLLPKIAVRRNRMNEGKYIAYQKLVKERQACTCCCEKMKNGNAILKENRENDIDDIGQWTYNHTPGIYNLDAEVMVIGQDWGNVEYYEKCIKSGLVNKCNICLSKESDVTSKNLEKGLKQLEKYLDLEQHNGNSVCRNYFLTNIVLCYKPGGMSDEVPKECYINCKNKFLDKLIAIIKPKIIITLGKATFNNFWSKSINEDCAVELIYKNGNCSYKKSQRFNDTILEGLRGNFVYKIDGQEIVVFPMAHPGPLGVLNRNKGLNSRDFIKDWEELNAYITDTEHNLLTPQK